MDGEARIEITEDGPYLVSGGLPLRVETIVADENDESVAWAHGDEIPAKESYALCRCGNSGNKPFCDGTHNKVHFDGTETAGHERYEDGVKLYSGPTMDMTDNPDFCSVARFCDARGKAWSNVKRTDTEEGRDIVGSEAMMCPSGRLIAIDKTTGEPLALEPEFEEQRIGLIEDPAEDCSGALWVQGGVEIIGADGEPYEQRNRVTLCRCGQSLNKPFCDGTHTKTNWKAD
ncbi:MAG: CDGSH iron-sulfur domain-containing protein [Solirubrobacterales bacterium]